MMFAGKEDKEREVNKTQERFRNKRKTYFRNEDFKL